MTGRLMGSDEHAVYIGHYGNLLTLQESTCQDDIGLDNIHGSPVDEFLERVSRIEVFAGCNGNADGPPYFGMALIVVGWDGLLELANLVALDLLCHPDGLAHTESSIGINQEFHVGAYRVSDRFHHLHLFL